MCILIKDGRQFGREVVGYLDATSTTIRSVKANEGLIGDVDYCEEVLYIPTP